MNKKGYTFELMIVSIIFFLLILPITFITTMTAISGSEGTHTGYVTAVEHNNNILWDADLVYFKTDLESTQEDIYCVNNKGLKELLKNYSKQGLRVSIDFQHDFWLTRSECNGGVSIIRSVNTE